MQNSSREPDFNALLRGLAAGEEKAFEALYDHYGLRLYRAALALSGDRQEAEDAVQDVVLGIVRTKARMIHVKNLTAYLFSALRHAVSRAASRRSRVRAALEVLAAEGPSSMTPEPDGSGDGRTERLDRALQALPAEQQEVLRLKLEAGLTFAEIAEVLDVNNHTAASRYRYALEKLRARFGGAS